MVPERPIFKAFWHFQWPITRHHGLVGFKAREFYDVYTVHDVLRYVSFSVLVDSMFVGASSVFHQLFWVPQGGRLSAQLASIFHCLQRGRFCPEALCAAQYVLRVLLHYTQHAQHVHNAKNRRITRTTRKTGCTAFERQT